MRWRTRSRRRSRRSRARAFPRPTSPASRRRCARTTIRASSCRSIAPTRSRSPSSSPAARPSSTRSRRSSRPSPRPICGASPRPTSRWRTARSWTASRLRRPRRQRRSRRREVKQAILFGLAVVVAFGAPMLGAAEKKPLPKDLPPFGEDKPLPVPSIAQSKLANGLTVWVVNRPGFPRVAAVLAVRGGSAADPTDAEGISELLADTLKEGTAVRTSRRIAEELQAVGGDIGAEATPDAIYVTANGLGSGAPTLLEVMADIAGSASFPAAEVELAKANALQALMAREATPEFLAQKAFGKAIYGEHPYHVTAPSTET